MTPEEEKKKKEPQETSSDYALDDDINRQRSGSDFVEGAGTQALGTAAVGAASGAAGGAVAGGLTGAATQTGGAALGATTGAYSGATSALAAAWPLAVLAAIYAAYRGYRGARKAAAQYGSNLTDEEVTASIDIAGTVDRQEHYLPKELNIDTAPELVGKVFGSHKNDQQVYRDRWRGFLKNGGVSIVTDDGKHYLELANGNLYDIGIDGSDALIPTLDPEAIVSDTPAGTLRPYEIDTSNPLSQQAVGFSNPVAVLLSGGNKDILVQGAGIFTNYALSNAEDIEDVRANMLHLYEKMLGPLAAQEGISVEEMALGQLQVMYDSGYITEDELAAYSNGVRQLYGKAPLTPPGTPANADPTNPEAVKRADPAKGYANNAASGGVPLDTDVNTIGKTLSPRERSVPQVEPAQPVGATPITLPNPNSTEQPVRPEDQEIVNQPLPYDQLPPRQQPQEGLRRSPTILNQQPEQEQAQAKSATGGTIINVNIPSQNQQQLKSTTATPTSASPPRSESPSAADRPAQPEKPVRTPEEAGHTPPPDEAAPAGSSDASILAEYQAAQLAAQQEAQLAAEEARKKSLLTNLALQEINNAESLDQQSILGRQRRTAANSELLQKRILGDY